MMTWTDFLSLPRSEFFYATRDHGRYACGNERSLYLGGADPEKASFDTGNNRAITLSGLNGELKHLTIFKESYYADNIPGVWVHKGRILAGPFGFTLKRNGEELYLPDFEGAVRTDLVECAIPITSCELGGLSAAVTAFAPLSEDGSGRPGGAFYVLVLRNTSDRAQEGSILLPQKGHFSGIMERGDLAQVDIRLATGDSHVKEVAFTLVPGAEQIVPVWLGAYGEPLDDGIALGAMHWLEQTIGYYRRLTGALRFENDDFLSEFLVRTLCQCQQCIGMDGRGEIAGSSWGTNPTTYQIWMKDMYYSMLPLAQADPALFKKGADWFARYGIRPAGTMFPGGVTHSLSNSLSAVLMAGQYHRATGDIESYRNNPALVRRLSSILDEMIMSRADGDTWLFPSAWISDGLSMGDFHTGSNITAWAALSSFADLLEALPDREKAETYRLVAVKVKNEILSTCVTPDGPYGPQFLEGVGEGPEELRRQMKAGSIEEFRGKNNAFGVQFYEFYNHKGDGPYLVHDGEETDTTLASFYGLLPFDEPVFKNYTRFAMSEHNRFYCPVSGGILWEDCTDSTFPGYVTGMANAVDAPSYREYFGRIRSLADLDGSIWWWPYPHQAKDSSAMRRDPGKCGWAAGALLALFWHDVMGIRYDGARARLSLSPLPALSGYSWKNAPLGGARFDIAYRAGEISVRNLNAYTVALDVQLFGEGIRLNGAEAVSERREYFGKPARTICTGMLPGERARISAR